MNCEEVLRTALAIAESIDHVREDSPYPTPTTPLEDTGHPYPSPGHAEMHQAQWKVLGILRRAVDELDRERGKGR